MLISDLLDTFFPLTDCFCDAVSDFAGLAEAF